MKSKYQLSLPSFSDNSRLHYNKQSWVPSGGGGGGGFRHIMLSIIVLIEMRIMIRNRLWWRSNVLRRSAGSECVNKPYLTWGGGTKVSDFFSAQLLIFSNSNDTFKVLDFSYFKNVESQKKKLNQINFWRLVWTMI